MPGIPPGNHGLSEAEAEARLKEFGPNAVVEAKVHPLRDLLGRFWAPIPWLLEATIVIQIFLDEKVEALVIAGLLIFNAVLGVIRENHTQKVLALLRQQLRVQARVRRDGVWRTVPAEELVPGDVLHLRQGGIVPADMRIDEGSLLVDQSALTGESAAVTVTPGQLAYAGAMVRGGEATGEVAATGSRTFFGKTADLVRTAHSVDQQEREIGTVVRNLFVINAAMIVLVLGYALRMGVSLGLIVPLLLAILLASIPVTLPATFTLTAAYASLQLSRHGVIITRLKALHDIASMTVLCTDKTGTLTQNEAVVRTIWVAPGCTDEELLRAAAMASDPAGQDPVDGAVDRAAADRGWETDETDRVDFKPFDPEMKRAEATYRHEGGNTRRATKGTPATIAKLAGVADSIWKVQGEAIAARGQRILAVAAGDALQWRFLGLLGIEDAVRDDSRAIVAAIQAAGVRVVMVTGDNTLTAISVAEQIGIPIHLCPAETLHGSLHNAALDESIFAGVFPEQKYKLVRALQRRGQVVGMSGDGVNDAPALRQAEVGIAVSNATDVAKAAAAIVLTRPGLGDVVPAIEESRRVFQRTVTYTLNMLTKKIELMTLLTAGFLLTGHKPLTPLMMVLFIFVNDFLSMSVSTDRMSVLHRPNHWDTRRIVIASSILAACKLAFSFGVFTYGYYAMHLDIPHLQTLTFVTVVLSTEVAIYLLRERGHFWESRPSWPLVGSSVFSIIVAVVLSQNGWLMAPIEPHLLVNISLAIALYFSLLDELKVWLFSQLKIR